MRSTLILLTLAALSWGCSSGPATTWATHDAIWNGEPTGDFPGVGALTVEGEAFCTGTLIDEFTVLTAAHCVDAIHGYAGADVRFFTGPGATGPLEGGIVIEDAEGHPDWNGSNADMGVVYLTDPSDAPPVFVQVDEMIPGDWEGRRVTLVGYGITGDGLDDSGLKMMTEVAIYAFDEDVFFHYTAGTNACFGDSGGPALHEADGRWWVVGVLSAVFGHKHIDQVCVGGGGYQIRPDVYTDWLQEMAEYNVEAGDDDDSGSAGDDDDTGSAGDDDDTGDGESLDEGGGGCQCTTAEGVRVSPGWTLLLLSGVLSRRRPTRTAARWPRQPRSR